MPDGKGRRMNNPGLHNITECVLRILESCLDGKSKNPEQADKSPAGVAGNCGGERESP